MKTLFLIIIGTVFVNNFVLARFLGLCPFMGVSKRIETATGMGMAVVFVMTVASSVTWNIQEYLLVPFQLVYLQTIMFILVIAALVQFVEMFIRKVSPALYESLGIFLPLITTNCAVLGVALLTVQKNLGFFSTITFAFGSSLGFTLALVLMAGIRERMELADIPGPFKGTASAFITAGILSLAFMGFSGMVK
ncbi:MAG TPA: electron transport complex subunit RsxA [Proteobacteria bacterium]|nr:electron transport complex protein RnfA [bacterium BMS3Abin14]HDL53680.1 electron transport complex subunit RsxA [Pseudomonadota bacterium]